MRAARRRGAARGAVGSEANSLHEIEAACVDLGKHEITTVVHRSLRRRRISPWLRSGKLGFVGIILLS
jgi:hypothetical protein